MFDQNFTAVIAQAVLLVLQDAFPFSSAQFDSDFQQNMCDTIYHLIVGISPNVLPCEKWAKKGNAEEGIQLEDSQTQRTQFLSNLLTSKKGLDAVIDLNSLQILKRDTTKQNMNEKMVKKNLISINLQLWGISLNPSP